MQGRMPESGVLLFIWSVGDRILFALGKVLQILSFILFMAAGYKNIVGRLTFMAPGQAA